MRTAEPGTMMVVGDSTNILYNRVKWQAGAQWQWWGAAKWIVGQKHQ